MSDLVGMKQPSVEAWAKWRGLLSEQLERGQSAAVFCRERGLAVWAFYAWKKRVREAEAAKFVEVAVKPVKPGCRSSAGEDKAIEIRLRSGLSQSCGSGEKQKDQEIAHRKLVAEDCRREDCRRTESSQGIFFAAMWGQRSAA